MEKDCPNCKFELYKADEIPCKDCGIDDREYWQPKPKTNADRIRAMSDEELAANLIQYRDDWDDYVTPNCEFYDTYKEAKAETIRWLQQPAKGE